MCSGFSSGLCVSLGCFSASGPVSSCQLVVLPRWAVDCAPPAQRPVRFDRSRQLSTFRCVQLQPLSCSIRCQQGSASLLSSASLQPYHYSQPLQQLLCAGLVCAFSGTYPPLCGPSAHQLRLTSPSAVRLSPNLRATSSTCVQQGPLRTSQCSASQPRAHPPAYIAVTFARADPLVHPRSSIASLRAVSTALSNFLCSVGSYLLTL